MRATLSFLSIALFLTGCLEEQRYITPEGGGIFAMAIDESTPPFFESEDGNLYLLEERVLIDFRQPTDEELAALGDVGDMQIPYAQLPWLRRGDLEIQVDFTLSNLSPDSRVTAGVVLNGINEFHEYNPGVQVVDDELQIDFSQWERTYRLAPGERISGTIREEEIDEIAVDLASVVNMAPNPNQIVYFENQSANDRRSQMYIPDAIPALSGLRVGIRSEAPVPVLLEFTLRVRDRRGVLVQGDDEPWEAPQPALFGPADAAAAMMMMTP
ncbi:MAG: hypothetical protein VYE22_30395 [Myxococcota bacterium]|nr:hypothetical protein [Myxococcota bacterium]